MITLPKKIVSVTEMQAFRKCRRAWYYSHIEGLTTIGYNANFFLGSAIHFALEKYYKENTKNINTLFSGYNEFIKTATKSKGTAPAQDLIELGQNMLTCYWYYDQKQPTWKIIAVEEVLTIPIKVPTYAITALGLGANVEGANVEGANVEGDTLLKFIIDLVIEDEEGDIWIVDHKTASQQRTNEGLQVDYQMTAYIYALLRAKGIRAKGVIYNNILKQLKYPPEILKDGTLSKNKAQKVTPEVYEHFVNKHELDIDNYKEMIELLKVKSPSVVRQYSTRSDRELELFEKYLYIEHADMQKAAVDFDTAYPNPSTYQCGGCEFLALCKEYLSSGDTGFIRSTYYTQKEMDYDTSID